MSSTKIRDMKPIQTRIVETLLLFFILAFVTRAMPNFREISSFRAAQDSIAERDWGRICIAAWMATRPPIPGRARASKTEPKWKSPKTVPVLPANIGCGTETLRLNESPLADCLQQKFVCIQTSENGLS